MLVGMGIIFAEQNYPISRNIVVQTLNDKYLVEKLLLGILLIIVTRLYIDDGRKSMVRK